MKRKHSILGLSVGVLFVAAMVVQGQEAISNYLYSTDIGSDLDMSDPITPGLMDAGAIYTPRGGPGNPKLWKDDDFPTPQWPGYPFVSAPQPLPSEIGTQLNTEKYHQYFDLDAEDQLLSASFVDPGMPQPKEVLRNMGVYSIYNPTRLSYDDDGAPGWAVTPDVPTMAAPDRVMEIHGTSIMFPPPSPGISTPLHDEESLQLGPNPLEQVNDDDVDALDWHPLVENPEAPGAFQARYFSPDHEANLGLDPGSIYLTLRLGGQNVSQVFDDVQSFGISEDADVDAFEFVAIDEDWAMLLEGVTLGSNEWAVAAIFSVDQDDPDTPGIDESGGLNPNIIYLTDLMGNHIAATGAYEDDIDALTVIPEPAVLALIGLFGGGMLFVRRFFAM